MSSRARSPRRKAPQHQHTSNIKIGEVGKSDDDELFVEVAVGEKRALLNVDKIADPRSGELKILTRLGELLITHASRTEFLTRVHDAVRAEPTLKVAIRTGWFRWQVRAPRGPSAGRGSEYRALF
jgi:hypothetical protein